MYKGTRLFAALVLSASSIGLAACGGHDKTATTSDGTVATPATVPAASAPAAESVPAAHHSKLGGALAGAAVGHMLGGHAVAGAAAGALIQHERNKHP